MTQASFSTASRFHLLLPTVGPVVRIVYSGRMSLLHSTVEGSAWRWRLPDPREIVLAHLRG